MKKIGPVISVLFLIMFLMIMQINGYAEEVKFQPIIKSAWIEAPASSAPTLNRPDRKSWEHLSDDFYYNKKKLIKSSHTLSVWTYRKITADEKNFLTEYFRESDIEKSNKYQTLDHQIMLLKIDCKKRLSKIQQLVNYDDKGTVLYEETYKNSDWKNISPNSKLEETYKKICVTPRTPKKHKKRNKPKKRSKKK